jgi:hypothetical protein
MISKFCDVSSIFNEYKYENIKENARVCGKTLGKCVHRQLDPLTRAYRTV